MERKSNAADVYDQIQIENQFKQITFQGAKTALVRQTIVNEIMDHTEAHHVAMILMKLYHQLVAVSTPSYFIKEHIKIT